LINNIPQSAITAYNKDMPAGAKKKAVTFAEAVSARYPGLLEKIQALIVEAERAFAGNAPEADGSFLWEHTVHVAGMAYKLAEAEKRDPILAAVTALFHDAGKFAGGRYHEGDVAEEARAAVLAGTLLAKARMKASERKAVVASLQALYDERSDSDPIGDIVHDADFLSKFGYLGVAAFFTKAALRGRPLRETVIRSLSKELTYAACLPFNMRTISARAFAERKAADSTAFYRALLDELRDAHDLRFDILDRKIPDPRRPGDFRGIRLVLPRRCEACGGRWRVDAAAAPGLKCEKLEARAVCRGCGARHEIAFCLPEIPVEPSLS
jgi:HD superfamily phosphodiesterase